jgi:hypothetical protein
MRLGRLKRDLAGDAMDIGLEPRFLGCFDHRFANAVPSVIKLAEFSVGLRQRR